MATVLIAYYISEGYIRPRAFLELTSEFNLSFKYFHNLSEVRQVWLANACNQRRWFAKVSPTSSLAVIRFCNFNSVVYSGAHDVSVAAPEWLYAGSVQKLVLVITSLETQQVSQLRP